MYTCANCGVSFEGKICPNCCTMRPAAAVLGDSGRILKGRSTGAEMSPGQRAARLAEDIEQSRRMDAILQEQLRREEEQRLREEAIRRREQAEREEEQRRLARQAQKASNWQRKAPVSRSGQEDEKPVVMPEALRSLKISGDKDKKAPAPQKMQPHSEAMTRVKEGGSLSSYPSVASIPPRRGGRGLSSAPSERIDAAWRAFARGTEEDSSTTDKKD